MSDSNYDDWIGRTSAVSDYIAHGPASAMAATLDREDITFNDGDPLPYLWHWLYFLERSRATELAPDGHAKRGGFLPPVHLPRRMWGGSRLRLYRPLRIGAFATRNSRISNVVEKQGRSGELVIVTIEHSFEDVDGVAITEEQDVAYRGDARSDGGNGRGQTPEAPEPQWSRSLVPDPVLLFRYSALTFNSHRIHYDQPYTTQEEGYPGLIVHGPLVATLLVEELLARHPQREIAALTIRAMRPLYQGTRVRLEGGLSGERHGAGMWAIDENGVMTLRISAEFDAATE